jgi:hypothetical protein
VRPHGIFVKVFVLEHFSPDTAFQHLFEIAKPVIHKLDRKHQGGGK